MKRERTAGLALLAPVLVALAFSYVRILASLDDVPHDDDYVEARTLLEAQGFRRPDDALAILPAWSLRPLTVVGDLEPISGDALAEQPLHRYARLFVLSEPGAESALAALQARRGAPAWSARAGRVVVERYDLPGPRATFDFTAQLDSAVVKVGDKAGDKAGDQAGDQVCDHPLRHGVSCNPKEWWHRVTREWLLVSENADLAVWAHPPPKGKHLTIEWSNVPIGSQIVMRAGHTRDGADRARAAVRVTVLVDGDKVDTVTRKPRFSFDTDVLDTKKLSGRNSTVTFVIETDDNSANHFAWDAYVVAP